MHHTALHLARVGSFAANLVLWRWVMLQRLPLPVDIACVVGCTALIVPVTYVGRAWLDRRPTPEGADWPTTVVHALVMALFGVAIVRAVVSGRSWPGPVLPVPTVVGATLFVATAAAAVLTVANLALRGLGAPFAIALSRRLAADWLYAWTRNPMVLATFACLVSVGIWMRSPLFVAWAVVLVGPMWIVLLKVFEERELEIRFGDAYRSYRARTPFLWPRAPGSRGKGAAPPEGPGRGAA